MQNFLLKSDGGVVAYVCEFPDGATVVRWRGQNRTTTVHNSIESVRSIHVTGHEGRSLETAIAPEVEAVRRALSNAMQDDMENVPWGSVGGDSRKVKDPGWHPTAPRWIGAKYANVYLAAYFTRIPRDAQYSWVHTLTVGGDDA